MTAVRQNLDDPLNGGRFVQAVQRSGVHQQPVIGSGNAGLGGVLSGRNHHPHRQVESAGEVQITLIMGGHCHDRAGAIVRQHVVTSPDRQLFAVDWVDRVALQKHAGLVPVGVQPIHLSGLLHLRQVVIELCLRGGALGQLRSQVAVGGHHEERRAVQRVGSRRVDGHRLVTAFDGEIHFRTGRAPDPVALHQQHLLRPLTFQLLHIVQQPVGVVGDPQIPLGQLLLRDR